MRSMTAFSLAGVLSTLSRKGVLIAVVATKGRIAEGGRM